MLKLVGCIVVGLVVSTGVFAQELPAQPSKYRVICEGSGCDAYVPTLTGRSIDFTDRTANSRVRSVLGGISGALIGEEIAGAPGAVGFGVLGAVLGHKHEITDEYIEYVQEQDKAHTRGDAIFYNPAHQFPIDAQWRHAGSGLYPKPVKK